MRVRSFFPPTVEQNDKFPLFYTPDFRDCLKNKYCTNESDVQK